MVTPAAKREALAHLKSVHEMSEAAGVPGDRLPAYDSALSPASARRSQAARSACGTGPGTSPLRYRRLLIFLRREGFVVNHKQLFRLYREERLMVRKRGWSAGDGSAFWRLT